MDTIVKHRIAAVLAVVLGAFVLACETDPRQPGHNPGQEAQDAEPVFTLEASVPAKCSPYHVTIDIKGGKGLVAEPTVPVAAGKWTHDVSYRSGVALTISLGVWAKPGCSDGYCKITDGPHVTYKPMVGAVGSAVCQANTKR